MRPLFLVSPALVYLAVLCFVPDAIMLAFSVFEYRDGVIYPGFTLEHYVKFLTDDFYLTILLRTLYLAIGVGVLTVLIGYPIAYFLVRSRSRWKGAVLMLVLMPLLASVVVRTYGWLVLLEPQGLVNQLLGAFGLGPVTLIRNYTGVFIGLVHVYLPYSILSIMASLGTVHPNLELAAQNLGAGRVEAFRRVTLPLTIPGMVTGFALTFSLTLSAFATPRILGGRTVHTTATQIYDQMLFLLNWPLAGAIVVIVLVISIGVLWLTGRFQARAVIA
jgi:putative spermidine/putrescine transport system permease protein